MTKCSFTVILLLYECTYCEHSALTVVLFCSSGHCFNAVTGVFSQIGKRSDQRPIPYT